MIGELLACGLDERQAGEMSLPAATACLRALHEKEKRMLEALMSGGIRF